MKSIISKILITGTMVAAIGLTVQAGPTRPLLTDTGKMSKMKKMDKMSDKKMDKMSDKKMSKMKKDTSKMGKM